MSMLSYSSFEERARQDPNSTMAIGLRAVEEELAKQRTEKRKARTAAFLKIFRR